MAHLIHANGMFRICLGKINSLLCHYIFYMFKNSTSSLPKIVRLLTEDHFLQTLLYASWRHQHYWPFVRGIHRPTVTSPHKGQWRGALAFSLICAWTDGSVNNRHAGDLGRYFTHYDVTVMYARPLPKEVKDKGFLYLSKTCLVIFCSGKKLSHNIASERHKIVPIPCLQSARFTNASAPSSPSRSSGCPEQAAKWAICFLHKT